MATVVALTLQFMKRIIGIILIMGFLSLLSKGVSGQCSVCTKTALQMGEKPAEGLNQGILYLMLMPFAIVGVIGFRWWRNNRQPVDPQQPNTD